jgi:hypothetical protein
MPLPKRLFCLTVIGNALRLPLTLHHLSRPVTLCSEVLR